MKMNPITIAKFFYIIYDEIFMFLFDIGQIARVFFGLILNYFAIIETNSYGCFTYTVWCDLKMYHI